MVFGVGITLVLFAGAMIMPIVGLVGVFLLPLPVLVYRLKLGRARGAAIATIAFVVMAVVLGGGSLDLFLFLALMVLGFVLGESFERRFSLEKTMLVACGALSLAGLLFLLFYSHSAGVGITDLISAYVEKNLSLYREALEQMGAAEETRQAFSASLEIVEYVMLRVLPGIAVSGILFTAWITLLLARPVLKRAKLPCPDYGSLMHWRAPEMLVWVLIGSGLLLLMPAGGLKLIGLNGLLVMLQVYFFQGIAIVSFFFEKKRFPLVARWVLYTLISLQVLLLVLVIGLGIFDMWLNVRKIESNPDD
jgi:uncharacterized protein YybS (DUF2232 family)